MLHDVIITKGAGRAGAAQCNTANTDCNSANTTNTVNTDCNSANSWLARSFSPAALGKAYEHHVDLKALHSAALDHEFFIFQFFFIFIFYLYEFCTTPEVHTRVKPPSHAANIKVAQNKE